MPLRIDYVQIQSVEIGGTRLEPAFQKVIHCRCYILYSFVDSLSDH
jgi:hypothetical protein